MFQNLDLLITSIPNNILVTIAVTIIAHRIMGYKMHYNLYTIFLVVLFGALAGSSFLLGEFWGDAVLFPLLNLGYMGLIFGVLIPRRQDQKWRWYKAFDIITCILIATMLTAIIQLPIKLMVVDYLELPFDPDGRLTLLTGSALNLVWTYVMCAIPGIHRIFWSIKQKPKINLIFNFVFVGVVGALLAATSTIQKLYITLPMRLAVFVFIIVIVVILRMIYKDKGGAMDKISEAKKEDVKYMEDLIEENKTIQENEEEKEEEKEEQG
jgi:ABC-type multidrug transport system fused ATPase/permease subunit